jgi:DNA repair ATPase RecN
VIEFHIKVLNESLRILKDIRDEFNEKYGNIDISKYEDIKSYDIKSLDALAYRFSKIQSLLGEKVFKEILEKLEYDLTNKSYIDILQYIEKEGIISSIYEWKKLREIRNSLSHDYPEEIESVVNAINEMLDSIDIFEEIVKKVEEKYEYANQVKSGGN